LPLIDKVYESLKIENIFLCILENKFYSSIRRSLADCS